MLLLARKSKMESHPRFSEVIEAVINNQMTQREGAKILQSTEPNFSQYLSRHYPKHKPKAKKKPKKRKGSAFALDKEGEAVITVELGKDQSNLEWGTIAWRKMIQNLVGTLMTESNLGLHDTVKLSRALTDLLKFQFTHNVPDIPKETVDIDEKMAKEIIDKVMSDHDTWCPYRSEFLERKDKEQSKSRLESAEPPLVE